MVYLKENTTHPDDYSSGLIPSSDMEISAFEWMVEEELEEGFGFFIFVSNDTTGETFIDIQGLFTCDRMNTNDRMLYSQNWSKKRMSWENFFGRLY